MVGNLHIYAYYHRFENPPILNGFLNQCIQCDHIELLHKISKIHCIAVDSESCHNRAISFITLCI